MNLTENPSYQAFTLAGITHIEPTEAAVELTESRALIVDVREQEELDIIQFDTTEIIHLPLSSIAETFSSLPKDKTLIIACSNGVRSVKVANLLKHQGFTNATNLDGGINQWYREGLPLVLRKDLMNDGCSSGGCGCGCSC